MAFNNEGDLILIVNKYLFPVLLIGSSFLLLAADSLLGDRLPSAGRAIMAGVYIAPVVLLLLKNSINLRTSLVVLPLLLLSLIYLLSALMTGGGLKYFIFIVIAAGWYLLGYKWSSIEFKRPALVLLSSVAALIVAVAYSLFDFSVPKNTVGSGIFYLLIISILIHIKTDTDKGKLVLGCTVAVLAMYFLDMRGAAFQAMILLAGVVFSSKLSFLTKNYLLWVFGFFLALVTIILFVGYSSEIASFSTVEWYVSELTGRSLHSGRQIIWPVAIELILDEPLFGHGAGFLINTLAGNETWSAHNTFLQVAMQTGVMGLAVLLITLFHVLKNVQSSRDSDERKFLYMLIWLVVLLYNCLEVSLVQNAMPIAVIQWLIFGMLNGNDSESKRVQGNNI